MEAFIAAQYFTDVSRSKYIYSHQEAHEHKYSSLKARIANRCEVLCATLSFQDKPFKIVSVCWNKPHYFIISPSNDIMWVDGKPSSDVHFVQKYNTIISLAEWIRNLHKLAEQNHAHSWADFTRYRDHKSTTKYLRRKRRSL